MKSILSSPKFLTIVIAFLALVVIPLTIIQSQNQQNLQQRADTVMWQTNQSAKASCPTPGEGIQIEVTFSNTEPNRSSMAMDVIAKDQQTGKSVDMGSIKGGETKTEIIQTDETTLDAGRVTFDLTWTDGHSGRDSRTASYKAVANCAAPTEEPTPVPSGQPTPTPTICPTLGPVKNVHIDCPNCQ